MKKLVQITSLSKSFGDQKVLDDIDFNLEKGEIVGLIGPSGSGKSTLIKTMLGMEKADKGDALIFDSKMPKREILSNIGYMAQSDALYEMLTGYENLEFFGKMKGVPSKQLKEEIAYVAKIVDLTDHLKKSVSNYSGGMKRRLSLAIALIGSPELLILDEPTVGIDPSLRRNIWKELFKQRDTGVGILVTTHVMDEAELTDKVGLLLRGDGSIMRLDTRCTLLDKRSRFPCYIWSCSTCGSSLFRCFHHRLVCQCLRYEQDEDSRRWQTLLAPCSAQHHCRRNLRLNYFLPTGSWRSCSYRRTAETDALASAAEDSLRGYCTAFNHSHREETERTRS